MSPRKQACGEVEPAIGLYAIEAGEAVALRFIDAVETAHGAISRHPSTGSLRSGHELDLAGLRSQLLKRYPYRILHIERDSHVEDWRVLHAQRDISAWLQEPQG